jgi:hypothetical protein
MYQARVLYHTAMDKADDCNRVRYGINAYANEALSGYIIVVAAVEAFLNEIYFGILSSMMAKNPGLKAVPKEWLLNIEPTRKLLLLPQLAFGKSISRQEQPFQDYALLVKVRNDLTHYKMKETPPKYIGELDKRGITIKTSKEPDFLWPHKLACTEGLRWAINTGCAIAILSLDTIPENGMRILLDSMKSGYVQIPESVPLELLRSKGVDPTSNHPANT